MQAEEAGQATELLPIQVVVAEGHDSWSPRPTILSVATIDTSRLPLSCFPRQLVDLLIGKICRHPINFPRSKPSCVEFTRVTPANADQLPDIHYHPVVAAFNNDNLGKDFKLQVLQRQNHWAIYGTWHQAQATSQLEPTPGAEPESDSQELKSVELLFFCEDEQLYLDVLPQTQSQQGHDYCHYQLLSPTGLVNHAASTTSIAEAVQGTVAGQSTLFVFVVELVGRLYTTLTHGGGITTKTPSTHSAAADIPAIQAGSATEVRRAPKEFMSQQISAIHVFEILRMLSNQLPPPDFNAYVVALWDRRYRQDNREPSIRISGLHFGIKDLIREAESFCQLLSNNPSLFENLLTPGERTSIQHDIEEFRSSIERDIVECRSCSQQGSISNDEESVRLELQVIARFFLHTMLYSQRRITGVTPLQTLQQIREAQGQGAVTLVRDGDYSIVLSINDEAVLTSLNRLISDQAFQQQFRGLFTTDGKFVSLKLGVVTRLKRPIERQNGRVGTVAVSMEQSGLLSAGSAPAEQAPAAASSPPGPSYGGAS